MTPIGPNQRGNLAISLRASVVVTSAPLRSLRFRRLVFLVRMWLA